MIARTWRGWTRSEDGERYLDYLHETGLTAYRDTPGNRGVLALRRYKDNRAEFLLVTLWESREAVLRFAGPDCERAVFYPEDERFLVNRDDHVDHFEVMHIAGLDVDQADQGRADRDGDARSPEECG